jgi:acyl-CoA synthetase (AMP-forming)/AMP-acid ligase II
VQAPDPIPRPLDHLTLRGASGAPALVTREGELNYAGLERAVASLAGALKARGLAAGARVASWLPKTRMTGVLPLACARAGLIHVPINPLLKRGQVAHILSDSGAELLITGEARLATLSDGDRPASCKSAAEEEGAEMLSQGEGLPRSSAEPDQLAALLYTSGSTGRPKGVMLSHANLWLGAISVAHYLGLASEDRTLGVLPLSFDYGQNQLLSTWAAGGCAIPIEYLAAKDVIRAVERHDVTTLAGVPPLWVQLIEANWPPSALLACAVLTNSGGRLPTSVVRGCGRCFPPPRSTSCTGLPKLSGRLRSIRRCSTSTRLDRYRHPFRRDHGRSLRRPSSCAGRGGRAGPCGAARRPRLLERSRANGRALPCRAFWLATWRHSRLVRRPRPRRRRRAALFRRSRGFDDQDQRQPR